MEIKQVDDTIYSNMQELSDELPDNSPRYVLLSYPLTMVSSKRVIYNGEPPSLHFRPGGKTNVQTSSTEAKESKTRQSGDFDQILTT